MAEGKTNREIAAGIRTTEAVVKNCMRDIFAKCGVRNRTELAIFCRDNGLKSAKKPQKAA